MPYQIKNGIIYSGNAVTLTQAQYDALTTAEKNNGTVYYIYDSDAMIEAQEVGLDGGNVETLAGSVATFETSPSTAVHAEGEYILYNAQLYKVTSAIAVGEDLTVGSNIEATNLGSELNAGLILSSNTALVSSISANTATSVVKIENVPKGHYVVSSYVRFSASGTSGIIYARINGSNRIIGSLYATDQYANYTAVIDVTSDNATVDIMLQISSARNLLATALDLLKV